MLERGNGPTCRAPSGRGGDARHVGAGTTNMGGPYRPTKLAGPKNPKKPENPGYNNYGIFWQFYGDFRFK